VRPRLDFLHGLRGLAALYVVVFHLLLNARPRDRWTTVHLLMEPFMHGYVAVAVFLVLSGFLLSVPVVRLRGALPGGLGGFLWRRSLRILPPYYAAYALHMLFFVAMSRLVPAVGLEIDETVGRQLETGYQLPNVVAHVLMVHNLSLAWVDGMSGIFWTIACEWQIYLLFAFLLVPLWRIAGLWAPLAVCALLGAVVTEACARGLVTYDLPWMIPAFGTGMAAADIAFGTERQCGRLRRWPWGAITAGLALATVAAIAALDSSVAPEQLRATGSPVAYFCLPLRVRWMPDVLGGLCAGAFIVWLAQRHPSVPTHLQGAPRAAAAALLRRLESPRTMSLGLFAYSLYLTHGMVVIAVSRLLPAVTRARAWHFTLTLLVGATASLLLAYGFYRLFERPVMARETRRMFTTAR
jgi:peptidoglycan/LPS O-acetylase OafA/YrhL